MHCLPRIKNHFLLIAFLCSLVCLNFALPPVRGAEPGKEEPVAVQWQPAVKAAAKFWDISYNSKSPSSTLNYTPELKAKEPGKAWDTLIFGGEPAIRDYTLSFQIHPAPADYEAGIIFRAQNIDSLYCLIITNAKAKTTFELQRWLHGKVKKLASASYPENLDQQEIQVNLRGQNIKVSLKSQSVIAVADDSFSWGKVGLICNSKSKVGFNNILLAVDKSTIPAPKLGLISAPLVFQVITKPKEPTAAAPAPSVAAAPAPAPVASPAPTPSAPPAVPPAPPKPSAPVPDNDGSPDTDTSASTPSAPPIPFQRFVEQVVDYNFLGSNNQFIDPNECIGAPNAFGNDTHFVSLGGGWIVLDMGGFFKHGPGGVDIKVYEVSSSLGDSSGELYEVLVSMYREGPWFSVGTATGIGLFDLSRSPLTEARYIKIMDKTSGDGSIAPGVDLDAVETLW